MPTLIPTCLLAKTLDIHRSSAKRPEWQQIHHVPSRYVDKERIRTTAEYELIQTKD